MNAPIYFGKKVKLPDLGYGQPVHSRVGIVSFHDTGKVQTVSVCLPDQENFADVRLCFIFWEVIFHGVEFQEWYEAREDAFLGPSWHESTSWSIFDHDDSIMKLSKNFLTAVRHQNQKNDVSQKVLGYLSSVSSIFAFLLSPEGKKLRADAKTDFIKRKEFYEKLKNIV